jgi:fructokinase
MTGEKESRSGFTIAAVGELLWDWVPGKPPRLGGAPANFAAMSANLVDSNLAGSGAAADRVLLVSRVGDDALGREALARLREFRVDTEYVSVDPVHSTGVVHVALDGRGNPSYRIDEEAAWDFLPMTPSVEELGPALDAIYFGTLAQRSVETRRTLRRLVDSTRPDCVRVFDVNLRNPWWTQETVLWGCERATILKMSLEETLRVANAAGVPAHHGTLLAEIAHALLRRFRVELIAVTRGAKGSLLLTRDGVHEHPGIAADVVDSIGAGDAFTATLTRAWLDRLPLPAMAEAANRWGAWAVAQPGGMPIADQSVRCEIETAVRSAMNA